MNIERNRKYVIIVAPNSDVFTNPTLDLFFKKLIKLGIGIILLAPEQFYYPDYSRYIIFINELPFIYEWKFYGFRERLRVIKGYLKFIMKSIFLSKLAVIGVDPAGFVTAARLNYFLRSKLGYFSFEMIFKDEINAYSKTNSDMTFMILKKHEERYFKKMDFLMIQDEFRLKSICDENKYIPENTFLIPVSGILNSTKTLNPDKVKFKKELGIPLDKKIVVFSGSLQEWTGLQIVLEMFEEKWDCRFWLLLHSRFELKEGDTFYDKITYLNGKGLPVSLHNQPFENMDELAVFLSSCDFGLVSYLLKDHPYTGKNIMEIGLASGKFSLYMMLGLPIIATQSGIYDYLLKQYNFGVLVEKIKDIPGKLHLLLDDYKYRSESCKNLYEKYLFPENRINDIITFIKND